jgi:hypothetical protein
MWRKSLQSVECPAVVVGCSVRTRTAYDDVRPGRPPIDVYDIRIVALRNEKPFYSAYSIASSLDISHSAILNHLRKSPGINLFIDIESYTSRRTLYDGFGAICPELLPILETQATTLSDRCLHSLFELVPVVKCFLT